MKRPASRYNFYRNLVRYRNSSAALTYGDIDYSGRGPGEVVSFIGRHDNNELLVLHNVSDVEVTVSLDGDISRFNEINFDTAGGRITLQDGELKLPAYSTAILKHD